MSILDSVERFGNSLNSAFIEGGKNTVHDLNKLGNVLNKAGGYAINPTHWDDMARGVAKAGEATEHATVAAAKYSLDPRNLPAEISGAYHAGVSTWHGMEDMGSGISFLATHPKYWAPTAKKLIKDQITNPVNLATNVGMLAATVATGGATAPAWMAKLGLGAAETAETTSGLIKVAQSADELSAASKAVAALKPIEGGAQTAEAAGRVGRYTQSLSNIGQDISQAKGLGKVGAVMDAPQAAIRATRSELLGMNEIGGVQRARNALADFVNPSINAEGVSSTWYEKYAYRKIAGGPGLADEGARTAGSSLQTRLGQFQEGLASPRQLRNKIQVYANVTAAVADPKQAATHLAHAAWNEYGDDAMRYAWDHKTQIMKALRGGDKPAVKAEHPFEPLEQPTQAIGLQQNRLDATHNTRTSQRRPNQAAQLGTVTTNTTMPTQIGPSNWYGPQGSYNSGRGFAQAPLPALEQPTNNVNSMQTLGV